MESKVIIAPLNWGLGHASRCIPIINAFIKKKWEVVLASDGDALSLLREEFPDLRYYELASYNIRYPFSHVFGNLLINAFPFVRGIINEKNQFKRIAEIEKANIVISDNRYGVRSKKSKNIFLGHQINIKAGNPLFSFFGSRINKILIRKFDELWIPDQEGSLSLAGDLAVKLPNLKTVFIGPLSRFTKTKDQIEYDICAVISGPEPQRTKFEKLLRTEILKLDMKALIIKGEMSEKSEVLISKKVRIISYATAEELNLMVNKSEVIISRCGYSTIMDLFKIQKKAILIPTPGQSEQEYLGEKLSGHANFIIQSQSNLDLKAALEIFNNTECPDFSYPEFDLNSIV